MCAANWHSSGAGLPSASCGVGAAFVFSGCSENRCGAVSEALLLDGAAGYVAEIGATKVSDLSPSCAVGYHGSASVSCVEDSGSFAFSGCAPNECIDMSSAGGAPAGYDVPFAAATQVQLHRVQSYLPLEVWQSHAGLQHCG